MRKMYWGIHMQYETYTQNFSKYDLAKIHAKTLAKEIGKSIKVNKHKGGFDVHVPLSMKSLSNKILMDMVNDMRSMPVAVGTFGASVLLILNKASEDKIDPLVLEAFRRSDPDLAGASVDQISAYLSLYSPEQLSGIINNVKGIYHEIAFVAAENADGDSVIAELEPQINNPGSDVILTDLADGSSTAVQLKATSSTSYVNDHIEKYPGTEVYATSEVSANVLGVNSSGFSNEELTNEVASAVAELTAVVDNIITVSDVVDLGLSGTIIAGTIAGVASYSKNKNPELAVKHAANSAVKAFKNSALFGLAAAILF